MKTRRLPLMVPVLFLLALMMGSLVVTAPITLAQGRNGSHIRGLITALNKADATAVQAALGPDFKLTLADGTATSGAAALQQLLGLPLPINIVSLTPQGGHVVSGMLQFGSSGPIAVTFGGDGGQVAALTITQPIGAAPSATPAGESAPATAAVTAGWNLIAGPTGFAAPGATGPLYTYQAGDTAYEATPAGSPLQPGDGYWAYFAAPATLTLTAGSAQPLERPLPAGEWVMIGNPFTTNASVAGADTVDTYAAAGGYQATTTLAPGQGAWAFSNAGGTLTLTSLP